MNDKIKKTQNDTVQAVNNDTDPGEKKVWFFKRCWDSYLKRLNKVTDGKPQCCK